MKTAGALLIALFTFTFGQQVQAQCTSETKTITIHIDQEFLATCLSLTEADMNNALAELEQLEHIFAEIRADSPMRHEHASETMWASAELNTELKPEAGFEFMGDTYPPMPEENVSPEVTPAKKGQKQLKQGYFRFMGDVYPPLPEEKVSFGFTM